jgi:hypothetical protein
MANPAEKRRARNDKPSLLRRITRTARWPITDSSPRADTIRDTITWSNNWHSTYKTYRGLHYVIGLITIAMSSLIALKPVLGFSDSFVGILAGLVAALASLLTFLHPLENAARFHNAWVLITREIKRYIADPSYPVAKVDDAWQRGEDIIKGTFHSEPIAKPDMNKPSSA